MSICPCILCLWNHIFIISRNWVHHSQRPKLHNTSHERTSDINVNLRHYNNFEGHWLKSYQNSVSYKYLLCSIHLLWVAIHFTKYFLTLESINIQMANGRHWLCVSQFVFILQRFSWTILTKIQAFITKLCIQNILE